MVLEMCSNIIRDKIIRNDNIKRARSNGFRFIRIVIEKGEKEIGRNWFSAIVVDDWSRMGNQVRLDYVRFGSFSFFLHTNNNKLDKCENKPQY